MQLLAGLDDELLARIEQQVESVHVRAGDWVLRRGERADCLYILRSGRVEVIDEGPPEVLIRVLRRGDVLGELALLGEGVRSASARARRDTELLRLSRDTFEGLITEAPSFALALTRAMGAQLAASLAPLATTRAAAHGRGARPRPGRAGGRGRRPARATSSRGTARSRASAAAA